MLSVELEQKPLVYILSVVSIANVDTNCCQCKVTSFFLLGTDIVLNHGTDCSPGTVTSQGKEGSSLLEPGNGICTGVTCGSPSVISCAESFPQGGGNGSNDLLDHTLCGQSEDPKDRGASADATQRSKQCCTRNMKSAPGSEETSAAGGDRSFSFEVGAPPNVAEKAHSSVWSPFHLKSTEVSLSPSVCVRARMTYINMVLHPNFRRSQKIFKLEVL
jgi:hypothetical protein